MKFALMERDSVHEIFEAMPVLAPGFEVIMVSDDVQVGYIRTSEGDLVPRPEPSLPEIPVSDDARMRLAMTEQVVLFFFETDEPLPADWKAYRAALRAIRDSGVLPETGWPEEPTLPAGL